MLNARNLKEALDEFPAAIKKAMENMLEEIKKLQEKKESRIIIPGS
ncbi:MAG: hypothetical protein KKH68_12725 [Proteobacteria bacterium]|nr:hypothetical protein [Pseudomonadota bacterium]